MIRADIAELFAELSGRHDELDLALYEHDADRRERLVRNTRMWRINNPKKHRALRSRARKAWRKRYPEKYRAAKKRQRDRNREKLRATWRRNTAAYRARKRALEAS